MGKEATTSQDPLINITDEFLSNPYPAVASLRAHAPVFWSEEGNYWIITRYADAKAVLSNLKFEKNVQRWRGIDPRVGELPQIKAIGEEHKHWILNMDPPDHTRVRALINKAFTPAMVSTMHAHIQDIADELIDKVLGKPEIDAIADYTFPLPITVIAELMGIPPADRLKFQEWSRTLVETTAPSGIPAAGGDLARLDTAVKTHRELREYFQPIVEDRRANPKDDLISVLAHAEEEGGKLTKEELLSNLVLFLVAGHETTTSLVASGIYNLLAHRDQLELLLQRPELIESAVNEILRFEGPVQLVRRLAAEDLELGGHKIKKGDMVVVMIVAANRDPEEFPQPDKFDITRGTKKHLGFGHAIHRCIGGPLAEVEAQIALSTLFKRLPNVRLKSEKRQWRLPFELRGVKELPLLIS
jgi:cytochrome P450